MYTIIISKFLKTVICQVHIVIAVCEIIVVGGCPQVAVFIHKNFVFASEKGPDTDIEFTVFEEKRAFYIFLNDTASELGSGSDEILQFFKV
jgi:hypothetical protein